jgi:hypothetical protein
MLDFERLKQLYKNVICFCGFLPVFALFPVKVLLT